MGYIIAFFIFIMVISFLGFLFSILWPVLLVLAIIGAYKFYRLYRAQKKMYNDFYESQEQTMFYDQDVSRNEQVDDVIDVEFSEEEVDKEN